MLKIVYVITSGNIGGAQIHLRDLIKYRPRDVEVHVVMGNKGWLWEELRTFPDVYLYEIRSLVRSISPIKDTYALIALINLLRRIKPTVVHCHSSKAGILGRIAGKLMKVPSVFTAHGWAFTEGVSKRQQKIYKIIESCAANLTEKIICVSNYDYSLAVECMQNNVHKLITIHNCIPGFREQEKKIPKVSSAILRLIMVARFLPQKNQILLLRALQQLKTKGIQFSTSFVGQGETFGHVKKTATLLQLEEDVSFLGERLDIGNLLEQHDIFVLTSNWEGFPISILEAMRQGMPIIASDVGGVKEAVINGENGFLIPRDDVECLCMRLEELFNNRQLLNKMSLKSQEQFEEKFKIDTMICKIYDVYKTIWARNLL